MSKYLRCYEIYKEMILEITKQGVIMITLRIVRVLDIKKVAYELAGPSAEIVSPQANNDSSNPQEKIHKNVSLGKSFN